MLLLPARDWSLLGRGKGLVLVQDTFWIQCGFADIAKMSDSCNSSPSRDSAAQKQRGERVMTSILDFHDYPEIETDGVRAVVVAL